MSYWLSRFKVKTRKSEYDYPPTPKPRENQHKSSQAHILILLEPIVHEMSQRQPSGRQARLLLSEDGELMPPSISNQDPVVLPGPPWKAKLPKNGPLYPKGAQI